MDVWWDTDKMWYSAFIVGKTRSDGWYEVRFVNEEKKLDLEYKLDLRQWFIGLGLSF